MNRSMQAGNGFGARAGALSLVWLLILALVSVASARPNEELRLRIWNRHEDRQRQ